MSISRTNDVLKVSNATRKAVKARDHQNVTGSQEVQHSAQLIAPCGGCATALLGTDQVAAGFHTA